MLRANCHDIIEIDLLYIEIGHNAVYLCNKLPTAPERVVPHNTFGCVSMQRSCCKSSELVDMNRNAVFYYVAGIVTAITLFTFKRLLSPNSPSQGRRKKAVFFGDSITSHGYSVAINGWLCNFAEWWVRRVDVINRGFSGYNSRWGLMIVGEIVVRENPDIVFVFFGANDAVDKAVGQHVPLDEYRKNMQGIVEKIKTVCHAA